MLALNYTNQQYFYYKTWDECSPVIEKGRKNGWLLTSLIYSDGYFVGILSQQTGWEKPSRSWMWNITRQDLSKITGSKKRIVNLLFTGKMWQVITVEHTGINIQVANTFDQSNTHEFEGFVWEGWKAGFSVTDCVIGKNELHVVMSSDLNWEQKIHFDSKLPVSYLQKLFREEGKIITELIELTNFPGKQCMVICSGNTGYKKQRMLLNPEGDDITNVLKEGYSLTMIQNLYNDVIAVFVKK